MPFPRMTTRRWLVAVAVVAVVIATAQTARQWVRLRALADYHAAKEAAYRSRMRALEAMDRDPTNTRWVDPFEWADVSERAAFHERQSRRYRRAARYPWLAVEPDRVLEEVAPQSTQRPQRERPRK